MQTYIKITAPGQSPTAPFWAAEINDALWKLTTAAPVNPDGKPSVAKNEVFSVLHHPDGRDNEVMMLVDFGYEFTVRERGGMGTLNAWLRQHMTNPQAQGVIDNINALEVGTRVKLDDLFPNGVTTYTREDLILDGWIVANDI